MAWQQRIVRLAPRSRGFHLITHELEQALTHMEKPRIGLLHLFLQHTSASLSINENADPDVPYDLEMAFRKVAPEEVPYRHTCEGPDDMPAHIKTSMLGCSLTIPIETGKLCLGTWQGVYLCEHRIRGGSRNVVLTLHGEIGKLLDQSHSFFFLTSHQFKKSIPCIPCENRNTKQLKKGQSRQAGRFFWTFPEPRRELLRII